MPFQGQPAAVTATAGSSTPTSPGYLVPVNADVPEVKAIYLEGEDCEGDPLGAKGLGELVLIGVAPALANTVINTTGRLLGELPITAEALL
ncbi:hypothetical protein [Streptomyces ipomoeae]|uniref:hypothetical protein n=1 Tax=Streptomyces ipomoeae TaxID=103232 RepID=UPI0029B56A1B|nr:hypothetical protein [Streptomyces ipomoeae]MDX2938609.1 hypothetical protein [Streptomyces ipomoeae]